MTPPSVEGIHCFISEFEKALLHYKNCEVWHRSDLLWEEGKSFFVCESIFRAGLHQQAQRGTWQYVLSHHLHSQPLNTLQLRKRHKIASNSENVLSFSNRNPQRHTKSLGSTNRIHPANKHLSARKLSDGWYSFKRNHLVVTAMILSKHNKHLRKH